MITADLYLKIRALPVFAIGETTIALPRELFDTGYLNSGKLKIQSEKP
jgi:hypothetical protein